MRGWAYACALLAAGCVREQRAAVEDPDCGMGAVVQMAGEAMCVYRDAIIETGFRCPAGMEAFDRGPLTVCAEDEPPPDFAERWCEDSGGCDGRPERLPDRDGGVSGADGAAPDLAPAPEAFEPVDVAFEGVELLQPYIRLSPPLEQDTPGAITSHGGDYGWPMIFNFGDTPVRFDQVEFSGGTGFALMMPGGRRTVEPGAFADGEDFVVGTVVGALPPYRGRMTLSSDTPGVEPITVELIGWDSRPCLRAHAALILPRGVDADATGVRRCGARSPSPTLTGVTVEDPEGRLEVGPLPPPGTVVGGDGVAIPVRVLSRPEARYIARIHVRSDDPWGPHQILHVLVEP